MKLRTEVTVKPADFGLTHRDNIAMMGSCFAENISSKLEHAGFRLDVNPFGIVYNPFSIAAGVRELLTGRKYTRNDLFENQGMFHSFSHHSRFSAPDADECVFQINKRMEAFMDFLQQASVLFITFGTSFVYRLKLDGSIVSNCHKLPDRQFVRKSLSVDEIVSEWIEIRQELLYANPKLKFVFTVSPVRHWKDGAHENQVSKSRLLIAVNELVNSFRHSYYFPSYEIMMDDLRDYRFYADDMLHPSSLAVDYIWDKFSDAFFNKETRTAVAEWQRIQQALNHRPFNPGSEEYKSFMENTKKQAEQFNNKYLL